MNKFQLVKALSEKTNKTRKDCELFLDGFVDVIIESLVSGEKVQMSGFGTFETRYRAPRVATNPQTRENINVPEKIVPVFKPGKRMKEDVNPYKEEK